MIDDTAVKINSFLSSDTRINSPEMRRAAEIYASACSELNASLAECVSLMDRGLSSDAHILAASFHPGLPERIERLERIDFDAWREICVMYSWPVSVRPDPALAERISGSPQSGEFSNLVTLWRGCARSGDPMEKVALLRRIIASAPSGKSAPWHLNLVNAERAYIPILLERGFAAAAAKDRTALEEVYSELTGGLLISGAPEKEKAELASKLAALQKESFDAEKRELLDSVGRAYMAMDADSLGSLLERWNAFSSTPGLEFTEDEKRQIAEASAFYCKRRAEAERSERFKTLSAELTRKLDDGAPESELKKTYNELRTCGIDPDSALVSRSESAFEAFALEQKRRHIRHTVYAVCAALLTVGAVWGAASLVQREREYSSLIESMERLLAEKDFTGVEKLFAEFTRESPALAERSAIKRICADAENLKRKKEGDDLLFAGLLEEANAILKNTDAASGCIFPNALAERLEKLSALAPERDGSERERFRVFTSACSGLREKCVETRTENFRAKAAVLENSMRELESALAFPETDPDSAERKSSGLILEYSALERDYADIAEKARAAHSLAVKALTDNFNAALVSERAKRSLFKSLTTPQSFAEYSSALEKLSVDPAYAQYASGSWKRAVSALKKAVDADIVRPTRGMFENPDTLKKAVESVRSGSYSPIGAEIRRRQNAVSASESFEKAEKILAGMKNSMLRDCDVYELEFGLEDGSSYRFYSRTEPVFQSRNGQVRPLAIDFELVLNPAREPIPYSIGINYTSGRPVFNPLAAGALKGLPPEFVSLEKFADMRRERKTLFGKARHFIFTQETVERLESAAKAGANAFSKELISRFDSLAGCKDMNFIARRAIGLKLLEMYSAMSPDAQEAAREATERLKSSVIEPAPDAVFDPRLTCVPSDQSKSVDGAFEQINAVKMTRHAEFLEKAAMLPLLNSPVPAGVITENGDDWKITMFTSEGLREALILVSNNPCDVFVEIPREAVSVGACPKNMIPDAYQGCVVYVSRSSLGLSGVFSELDAESAALGLTPCSNSFRPRKAAP